TDHGVAIGIGGVHPFARWQEQEFVASEAYRWVGDQLQNVARRNLSFGLHVHVFVADDDTRVYVSNQLRRWAAPLLSLSANAPFFEGADTGFRTIRMQIFGAFPRTGFPPRFRDWAHHQEVIDRLIASGAIEKPRQVWWNVRPHVAYRTVELRMIDMQISPARTRAFVALSQALTASLIAAREAGEPEWELEPAYLDDGWFKAQRFGWDEPIAHPITGETVTLRAEIEAMLDSARPWAERLGTTADAVDGIERILEEGPECEWQRAAWRECGGDFGALQRRIFDRVRDEAGCPETVSAD
ncbi:MAG: YbdK family carboxylate-amine ligase, partial [Gemmatimonadota bacterium]|nr:YbdK family carboxylate-amine ligase [Gemmatimonadota bacterium]